MAVIAVIKAIFAQVAPFWCYPHLPCFEQLPLTCIKSWARGVLKRVCDQTSWVVGSLDDPGGLDNIEPKGETFNTIETGFSASFSLDPLTSTGILELRVAP